MSRAGRDSSDSTDEKKAHRGGLASEEEGVEAVEEQGAQPQPEG
jgi:hypothetical protein